MEFWQNKKIHLVQERQPDFETHTGMRQTAVLAIKKVRIVSGVVEQKTQDNSVLP